MTTFLGLSVTLPPESTAIPIRCDECQSQVLLAGTIAVRDLGVVFRAFLDEHAECILDRKEQKIFERKERESKP